MPTELIPALESADGRIDRWIALLWTWLKPRLRELESSEEKLRSIRARVCNETTTRPDLEAMLDELRASPDLTRDAAACLARIECWIVEHGRLDSIFGAPVGGIDGRDYFVRPARPWLVDAFWGHDRRSRGGPPAADYAPSMQILAPRLIVVPSELDGVAIEEITLTTDTAGSRGFLRARQHFETIAENSGSAAEEPPRLVIHFATLGPNSLEGFTPDERRDVFHYGDPNPGGAAEAQIELALVDAVDAAAEADAAILILPELAVPVRCLSRLQALLADADPAPALTVAGLRHNEIAEPGDPPRDNAKIPDSRWANEAVVLGDDGSELFRHRKLTSYTLHHDSRALQEDTRLGRRLPILPTAIGNIAVATCLDSFGATVERLRESHASIVLVPSLSTTVTPHRTALAEVVRWLWGAAFVCNRHPSAAGAAAWLPDRVRSFWSVALLNGCSPARQTDGSSPTLVFDLAREAAANQPSSSIADPEADTSRDT